MAIESRGDLASRHGSIGRIAVAHSGSYRSDNPVCTRTPLCEVLHRPLEITDIIIHIDTSIRSGIRFGEIHIIPDRILTLSK